MINSVTATTDTTAAAAAMKKATGLNSDDFLKLFITQLQNQDPLNPQDSSQFIAQLAQLTQVEQSYNTNTNLQNLLNQGNNSTALSAVSFIGKEVVAPGTQVSLQSGTPTEVNYRLPSAAQSVSLSITDSSGAVVKTLALGQTAAGDGSIAWDGTDNRGAQLPAGTYNVAVTGANADGSTFAGTALVKGKVDGVDMEGTSPSLTIGSLQVPITSVLSVKGVV